MQHWFSFPSHRFQNAAADLIRIPRSATTSLLGSHINPLYPSRVRFCSDPLKQLYLFIFCFSSLFFAHLPATFSLPVAVAKNLRRPSWLLHELNPRKYMTMSFAGMLIECPKPTNGSYQLLPLLSFLLLYQTVSESNHFQFPNSSIKHD